MSRAARSVTTGSWPAASAPSALRSRRRAAPAGCVNGATARSAMVGRCFDDPSRFDKYFERVK
ncbi:MAG: hypothetical protein AB1761_14015 [Pseudomonadota bacterium]